LGRRLGMMMESRSDSLYRTHKILALLIQYFKSYLVILLLYKLRLFLRSHTIRLDQPKKEKPARKINNAGQSFSGFKKDKFKTARG
jgi:hypothetical protein